MKLGKATRKSLILIAAIVVIVGVDRGLTWRKAAPKALDMVNGYVAGMPDLSYAVAVQAQTDATAVDRAAATLPCDLQVSTQEAGVQLHEVTVQVYALAYNPLSGERWVGATGVQSELPAFTGKAVDKHPISTHATLQLHPVDAGLSRIQVVVLVRDLDPATGTRRTFASNVLSLKVR